MDSFDWEGFENTEFVVNCRTEESAREFIEKCHERGLEWKTSGDDKTLWKNHRENTCYSYNYVTCDKLGYSKIEFYKNVGFEIIEYTRDSDIECTFQEVIAKIKQGEKYVCTDASLAIKYIYNDEGNIQFEHNSWTSNMIGIPDSARFKLKEESKEYIVYKIEFAIGRKAHEYVCDDYLKLGDFVTVKGKSFYGMVKSFSHVKTSKKEYDMMVKCHKVK